MKYSALDLVALEKIQLKKPLSNVKICQRFDEILERQAQSILQGVQETTGEDAVNLFELVGATKLVKANRTSRLVSTHLGKAWEEMASLSHLALNPERDLGTRIEGIDIILLDGQKLRHTQIKTQRNTLTGSQKGRSITELRRHPFPLFAAAFDVASWTFPPRSSSRVDRIAGEPFWNKLSISYEDVVEAARKCFAKLEDELFKE
jgi:hypothetical protein